MSEKEKTKEELQNELSELKLKYDSLQDLYNRKISNNSPEERYVDVSETQYRLMVENAPLSYQSLDIETRFLYVNNAWLKTLGYEREEVIGHRFGEFMTPASEEMIRSRFPKFLKAGEVNGYEFEMVRKDGTVITVAYEGKIGYDKFGNFKQTHCIFEDISKRKQAEDELRKSEEKYRFMFHDNPQPNWIFDTETLEFLEVNEAALQLYGYTKAEFLSMKATDIRPAEDLQAFLEDFKKNSGSLNLAGEWRHIKKNGDIIYVEIISHPVVYNGREARHIMITDNTERRLAQKALKQANDQLERLYNSLDEAIFSVDSIENKVIYASKACELIFDYPFESFLIHPDLWYKLVIPEDRHIVDEAMSTLIQGQKFYNVFRKLDSNGQIQWIEVNINPTYDTNRKLIRVDGIASDITMRKKVEINLVESELNFRRSISESPVGIRIITVDGKTVYTNKTFLELYDFKDIEEFKNTPASVRYTAESYIEHLNRKNLRKAGLEFYDYEISIQCRNGEVRHLKVTRKEIMWNAVKHFQIINLDITKQRNAEEQLRKLSIAVEQSPDAICITDPEGKIEYVNPQTIRLTGYSKEELIGVKTSIFNSDTKPKAYFEELWKTIKSGKVWQGELLNKKKNAELYWESITISPIFDKDNRITHFLGIKEDIGDKKQSEKALLDSQEQLRQFASHIQNIREEEKVALAREIHDDLGQILVVLKIETGLLKLKVMSADSNQKPEDLVPKFNKILELIDNTIKTSRRIMNGLRPELLEIHGFVGATNEYIKDFEMRNKIECEFECKVPDIVMNKQQSLAFFRILQESMNNIVKHAKASKVTVLLKVEKNKLMLEISDNGVGIDKNIATRKDAYGMIGMKERMILLNGTMRIESKVGKGTKVKAEIPYE